MTQAQLAGAVWPGSDGEDRKGDISKLENGRVPNPHETTVLAICRALEISIADVNALRLAPPPDPYALAGVLNDLKAASQADLYSLARAFGIAAPEGLSDAKLRAFLTDKAREYQSYRATIDALDDRVAAIANLKGAAQDAAERLDFDAVEDFLSRVQTVELEIAATTAEARAENALLRGRVEQDHALLSAAADSFAAVDPLEVAWRRGAAGVRLYEHGQRYGGAVLPLAIRLLSRLIDDLPRAADPALWAAAHNIRAIALRVQGSRTAGAAGTALLARAVADCTLSLEVSTRADHPVGWAATLQNRAGALQAQGSRTAGAAGTALLARAVAEYTLSLEVYTRADHPVNWARTLQNCAGALQAQGSRTEGAAGEGMLAQAVADCTLSLEVYTRADHPVNWARTLQNRAGALQAQGSRTEGAAGTALLAQGVADYTQTLEVTTRADHPVNWATTRENMALLEVARARHDSCTDPLPHLRAALGHVEAALEVYDPEHMSFYHKKASTLRDLLLSEIARLTPQS